MYEIQFLYIERSPTCLHFGQRKAAVENSKPNLFNCSLKLSEFKKSASGSACLMSLESFLKASWAFLKKSSKRSKRKSVFLAKIIVSGRNIFQEAFPFFFHKFIRHIWNDAYFLYFFSRKLGFYIKGSDAIDLIPEKLDTIGLVM